ncbi:hypothetical protein NMR92_003114 [Vibrio cholerae]|mgnify:CR=1 FL=1|uniref:hypothetical protein n=1 Tax=Vibrio sp. YQ_11 TaxID=3367233 RepID=UPI003709D9C3|nr:hypothetical protein [Vibrio cholerae]EJL6644664.1 hypothetical protein [Vibrio cholerae]
MRITEKRLSLLLDLKPRISDQARQALIDIICHQKKLTDIAEQYDLSPQGIRKNIRELEILDLKVSSSYDSSLFFSEYAHRLCMNEYPYVEAITLLSSVCRSLGGEVNHNRNNGDYTFTLDDMIYVTYLNDFDDPVRPWGIDSYLK